MSAHPIHEINKIERGEVFGEIESTYKINSWQTINK